MVTLEKYKYDSLPKYAKCAIVGRRGAGKTFLCRNLVQSQLSHKNISHTYIICCSNNLHEWKDKLNTLNISYHDIINENLISEMKLKINLDEEIIIVIDNLFLEKNQYDDILELKALILTTYPSLNLMPINYTGTIFFLREKNHSIIVDFYLIIKKYFISVPTYKNFIKLLFAATQNYSAIVVDGYSFGLFIINANDIIIKKQINTDYITESVDSILKRFEKESVKFISGFEILI
ncbi:ATPase [Moumouvirus goulette]|uniref:ATPase n=1 Tax=Moumouvirus goulette TaxID=1247379 RepID=M1PW82_9VIRU|nr:ATPase [Moumouvirus goulette]AGF84997.1 ATPase [Moumouvirus goulette]